MSCFIVAGFMLALAAVEAGAQRSWFDDDRDTPPAKNIAGQFDYYSLVLSWSPTHCSTPEGSDDEMQCNRRDGRRYAFILHGLWPQYERGWPQNCRTRRRPFVPQPLINSMLDIMPSQRLVIHEYRKHGTCSGLEPDGYFQLSRALFASINIPKDYVNPYETQFVSPRKFKAQLIAENPQLDEDMISVVCASGPRGRLREIRICFSKDGKPRQCGSNENQRRQCSAEEMSIPPVRSAKTEPDSAEERDTYSRIPLPGPRVIPSPR